MTTRRPTQTASTDGYIVRHSLFGPRLTDARSPEPAPRDGSDARARTLVARVDAPAGTTRAPVIVAADLDVFGDRLSDVEVDTESFANRGLLAGLVGQLAIHGFHVAHGGRVWGTVGEAELKLAGDETVRVVFGAPIEHERAAIVEGRDDDAVWIYAVDEAIVRRVLGPS